MDLKDEIKVGDIIIAIKSGRIFKIKYMLGMKAIVNNGVFDFPLDYGTYAPYSPLLEELL